MPRCAVCQEPIIHLEDRLKTFLGVSETTKAQREEIVILTNELCEKFLAMTLVKQ
jgi:hypothetical protein